MYSSVGIGNPIFCLHRALKVRSLLQTLDLTKTFDGFAYLTCLTTAKSKTERCLDSTATVADLDLELRGRGGGSVLIYLPWLFFLLSFLSPHPPSPLDPPLCYSVDSYMTRLCASNFLTMFPRFQLLFIVYSDPLAFDTLLSFFNFKYKFLPSSPSPSLLRLVLELVKGTRNSCNCI